MAGKEICTVDVPKSADCFDLISAMYRHDQKNLLNRVDIGGFSFEVQDKVFFIQLGQTLSSRVSFLDRLSSIKFVAFPRFFVSKMNMQMAIAIEAAHANEVAYQNNINVPKFEKYEYTAEQPIDLIVDWNDHGHVYALMRPVSARPQPGDDPRLERGYIRVEQTRPHLVSVGVSSVTKADEVNLRRTVKREVVTNSFERTDALVTEAGAGVYHAVFNNCHQFLRDVLDGLGARKLASQLKSCRFLRWVFNGRKHLGYRSRRAISVKRPDSGALGAYFSAGNSEPDR